MKKLIRTVLAAVALSAVAAIPAQAGPVIDFDGGLDTSLVWFPPLMTHGDALVQGDYYVSTVSTKAGAAAGDLVGALVDGSDVASTCMSLVCPTNNPTQFLAMLNDGLPFIGRLDGAGFQIKSVDASFIAAAGAAVPPLAMILRVYGFTDIGGVFFEDILLPGPVDGILGFASYDFSDASPPAGTSRWISTAIRATPQAAAPARQTPPSSLWTTSPSCPSPPRWPCLAWPLPVLRWHGAVATATSECLPDNSNNTEET